MPSGDLDNFSPNKSHRFYLDSSAVIPAGYLAAKASGETIPLDEEKRGARLARFVTKAAGSQSLIVTSILAMEELASSARGKLRDIAARKASHPSWKAFKNASPTAASKEDITARLGAVKMANYAIRQLAAWGVELDEIDTSGGSTKAAAIVFRDQWLDLLTNHAIDPMDALHIVVGKAIGATHFITFDNAWGAIPSITALR